MWTLHNDLKCVVELMVLALFGQHQHYVCTCKAGVYSMCIMALFVFSHFYVNTEHIVITVVTLISVGVLNIYVYVVTENS
jgi:hypothetical protein